MFAHRLGEKPRNASLLSAHLFEPRPNDGKLRTRALALAVVVGRRQSAALGARPLAAAEVADHGRVLARDFPWGT